MYLKKEIILKNKHKNFVSLSFLYSFGQKLLALASDNGRLMRYLISDFCISYQTIFIIVVELSLL